MGFCLSDSILCGILTVLYVVGLQWKLPTQLLICSDPLVREIVSGSLLRRCLGLDYLNLEVEKCLNISLLESLGVQSLTTYHLIEVGKSMVATLNASGSDGMPLEHICRLQIVIYISHQRPFVK